MSDPTPQLPRRIWVQEVAVSAEMLRTEVEMARAAGLDPQQEAAAVGVLRLLDMARAAAYRKGPVPGWFSQHWNGTLVEAAYLNLHAARALAVEVLDEPALAAEIAPAIARAQTAMHPSDQRRVTADELAAAPLAARRALVRRLVRDSYEALDLQHTRLRSFRNIVVLCAALVTILVVATVAVVSARPSMLPLCFAPQTGRLVCPSGTATGPQSADVLVVALIGLLGGALSATVAVRNLRGSSSAYDVPAALAVLKVPLGAFTAIVGILVIRGGFIPGLTALDTQDQILGYALVLGFAQQAFTRLLDSQAQTLLTQLPAKDPRSEPPATSARPTTVATAAGTVGAADATGDVIEAPSLPTQRDVTAGAADGPDQQPGGQQPGDQPDDQVVDLRDDADPTTSDDGPLEDGSPVLPDVVGADTR
ncbi:hypothetical protein EV189_2486 [Motilibacter rhizosphaerae]|uniref:Uncharacterized protein n=1 Tax=Motilibacter rhizosphaerae TaxID=598652 RepID=A0A4Q7NP63_9ACTN|nr:hypothetical protein [Motilibacter rhizosphaerae]RZS87064.1 hypothetical protein EV189_2486 [Motilibacter rhizosphaerae]